MYCNSLQVVCSDKTGTLTTGEMTCTDVVNDAGVRVVVEELSEEDNERLNLELFWKGESCFGRASLIIVYGISSGWEERQQIN
jgi:magnesium-transporting ATPase (P-type)